MTDDAKPSVTVDDIADKLLGYRFRPADEYELQEALHRILSESWPCEREVITDEGRLDLLVDGAIAVEVKVHGSAREVTRQLRRYSRLDQLEGMVLVTTRAQHVGVGDGEFGGKPLRVVPLLTGGF